MDYEKKYKEALEKARQLCAYPTTNPFISDLQDLFPELAESEDEYCINQLIIFCEHCMVQDSNAIKCANWLKSLKNRVQPQPKQEWSKDDYNFIKELCDLLASISKDGYVGKYYTVDLVERLKSLKPQNTWKPSDEQMKFLQKCIEVYNEVTFPTEVRVLSSLYNDLKKLRKK